MSDATSSQLDRAYELIQQEKLDEAIVLLDDILAQEPDQVDAWWLKANAVRDPDDAREALEQVLRYDPGHQEAQELIAELNETYPPEPALEDMEFSSGDMDFDSLFGDTNTQAAPPPTIPDLPEMTPPQITRLEADDSAGSSSVDLTDLFGLEGEEGEEGAFADSSGSGLEFDLDEDDLPPDFEFEVDEAAEAPAGRRPMRRRLLLVLVLAVLVVALLLVVVLGRNRGATPVVQATPEATSIADNATPLDDVTSDADVALVLNSIEETANAQAQVLGGESTVDLQDRQLGTTLVLQVCRSAGTDLPAAMNAAMQMAASQGSNLQGEIAAIAVDLVNCQREDVLMRASVPIARAVEYAAQSISDEAFRASWQLEY